MKWKKIGLIYCPSGGSFWMQSHAAVPIAESLRSNRFRVYFSSRDTNNRSHTGYVDFDIDNPQEILKISDDPVLSPGELGAFDDSGAMATWLLHENDRRLLYYIGWNLGVTVPFRNSIGLAISTNDCQFSRYSRGPILDRTSTEPHFVASCAVIEDAEIFKMWYLSCVGWEFAEGTTRHRYHIKYAESPDGIIWDRRGIVAIDFKDKSEYAISRPSVIRDIAGWHMWYSYRGETYRIGYAFSEDGVVWQRRDDQAGIDVSDSGWDSEMIEYPFVFDHDGSRYMLYNGNGYGQTGFGLAILES